MRSGGKFRALQTRSSSVRLFIFLNVVGKAVAPRPLSSYSFTPAPFPFVPPDLVGERSGGADRPIILLPPCSPLPGAAHQAGRVTEESLASTSTVWREGGCLFKILSLPSLILGVVLLLSPLCLRSLLVVGRLFYTTPFQRVTSAFD